MTRALGPEGRGFFATAVAIGAIGVQLGNLGLHASNTWVVARDRSLLGVLIANSLTASAVIGGLVAAVVLLLAFIWPDWSPLQPDHAVAALISIPIGLAYLLLQNLLLGTDRIRAYNGLDIGSRNSAPRRTRATQPERYDSVSAYAVAVVLAAAASLVAVSLVAAEGLRLVPSRTLIFEHATYGLRAYLAAMVSFLLLRVDVLFVQVMRGAEQTGYYSVAVSLTDNILLLPIVVGSLLFVGSRQRSTRPANGGWRVRRHGPWRGDVALGVAALSRAEPIVRLLFGEPFMPAVPPLMWLLPGVILMSVNTPLMNYFASVGMPFVVIIGPLAPWHNIVLNLWPSFRGLGLLAPPWHPASRTV